ncbi:mavicyanin-like [Cynara cardunculus var. scolymus]|uniref:Cupredoxin n=1 Tax=Cynara cardunculus var. scolymus TaxID=59895 RepID=A0A103XJC5_CYNCS|nr:mavicyanin-like [Cynara cardunculus var. scolymus]KVH91774.1 Cupredoxin [Cynara cardunculus var. scolymus]
MATVHHHHHHQWWFAILFFFFLIQSNVLAYQYQVGNLQAWNIPTSAEPKVYSNWPKKLSFKIGDSLLFLYPPSQDSVIQVTKESYNSCNLKDPILYMNNGNSLFNITSPGVFYFTSGVSGHCEKSQKIQIAVFSEDGSLPPASGPSGALADSAPSYQNAFGGIPSGPSSSSQTIEGSMFMSVAIGVVVCGLVGGKM